MSDSAASGCVDDGEVGVIGRVCVKLLTGDDEVVRRGVLKGVDVGLVQEERLLGLLHADEVDAQLVNDGGLLAVEGGEASQLGILVSWEGAIIDQLGFTLQSEKAGKIIC